VITADFSNKADFVWRFIADLVEILPGEKWQTPEKFVQESLCVAINGQMLNADADNGFVINDDETFSLKIPITRSFFILVGYIKQ